MVLGYYAKADFDAFKTFSAFIFTILSIYVENRTGIVIFAIWSFNHQSTHPHLLPPPLLPLFLMGSNFILADMHHILLTLIYV